MKKQLFECHSNACSKKHKSRGQASACCRKVSLVVKKKYNRKKDSKDGIIDAL